MQIPWHIEQRELVRRSQRQQQTVFQRRGKRDAHEDEQPAEGRLCVVALPAESVHEAPREPLHHPRPAHEDEIHEGSNIVQLSKLFLYDDTIPEEEPPMIETLFVTKEGEQQIDPTKDQNLVDKVKNKVGKPFRSVELEFTYGLGYTVESDVTSSAKRLGILEMAGSWVKYKGTTIVQGIDNLVPMLFDNPDLLEDLKSEIAERTKKEIDDK